MNAAWWVSQDDLNDEQRAVFSHEPTQSSLIVGPPGSGKTNLLLLRASQLVRSGYPNILILVFTRALREFIATGGPQYAFATEKIMTCMGWAIDFLKKEGCDYQVSGTFEEKRRELVKRVKSVVVKQNYSKLYTAILLDEAQDYYPDEIELFCEIAEVVHAAADKRQQIYKNEDDFYESLRARFSDEPVELKYHYRNGISICEVADELGKVRDGYIPMRPTCNYNEAANPSRVLSLQFSSWEEELDELVTRLTVQLDAYPGELLGVLCPTKSIVSQVASALGDSTLSERITVQGDDSGALAFSNQTPICVCTAHSAKGLEFRAAHIVEASEIKGSLTRNIAYTSVTRAKTFLGIYAKKSLPGYLDQALKVLEPKPPTARLDELFGS